MVEEGECGVRELLQEVEAAMKEDYSCVNKCTGLLEQLVQAHSLPARARMKQSIGIKLQIDVDGAVEWVGQLCDVERKESPNVELLTVAGEPFLPDQSSMKPISSSSSTVSSFLPSSSPSKLGPSHSGNYLGDQESVSSRTTSVSPVPRHMPSPLRAEGTSSPVSQSTSGGDMCLVEVEVVHVVDPDHIYVRDANQSKGFCELQERVRQCCEEQYIPLHEDNLILGFQCAAQDLDDVWYRVIITDITRDYTAATVQFVDCGKTCLLPVARLSMLSSSLRVCPPQVARCRLHAIVHPSKHSSSETMPVKWRDTVTSIIKESLTEKVSMKVFERSYYGVLYVDLFAGPVLSSLSDKLVVGGLAVRTHSRPHLLEDVIPPPLQLGVGDRLQVQVMAAQTPWDFYFQDASNYCYEECEQLKVKLETAYRHGDLLLVGVPLLNMYVAARFSEDQQLYRAKVIELFDDGNLRLLFVDYGNTEVVDMDHVYKLPQHILQVRQQAVHGRLHGVHPLVGEKWSEESSDFFHALCDGHNVSVKVRNVLPSGCGQQSPEDNILSVSLALVEADDQDVAGLMIAARKAAADLTPANNGASDIAADSVLLNESNLTKTGSSASIASCNTPTFTTSTLTSPLHFDYKSTNVEEPTSTSLLLTPPTPTPSMVGTGKPPTPTSGLVGTGKPPTPSPGLVGTGKPPTPTPGLVGTRKSPTPTPALVGTGKPLTPAPALVGTKKPLNYCAPIFVPATQRSSPQASVDTASASSLTNNAISHVPVHQPQSSRLSVAPPLEPLSSSDESPFSDVAVAASSDSSVGVTSDHASSQSSSISSQSSPFRSQSHKSLSAEKHRRPVGRAAWRTRQQASTTSDGPFTSPAGRATYHRRDKSSKIVGYNSDYNAPALTGRAASTPPGHSPSISKDQSSEEDWCFPSAPPSVKSSSRPSSSDHLSKSHLLTLPHPLLPVQVGGVFKCRVVYVTSPKLFFVHVEDNPSLEGEVMTVLASSQQELEEVSALSRPERGQLALARYEGMWHRVLVQGPGPTPCLHLVLYVDYGNVDEVDVLKPIPPGLAKFPPRALQCGLHKSQSKLSRDRFCQLVADKIVTAELKKVVDGVMMITLRELSTKVTLPNHFILPVTGTN